MGPFSQKAKKTHTHSYATQNGAVSAPIFVNSSFDTVTVIIPSQIHVSVQCTIRTINKGHLIRLLYAFIDGSPGSTKVCNPVCYIQPLVLRAVFDTG